MLLTIAIVLLHSLALGLISGATFGGWIHGSLVVAVILFPGSSHRHHLMSSKNILAIILIAFGIIVLAYSGICSQLPARPWSFWACTWRPRTTISYRK